MGSAVSQVSVPVITNYRYHQLLERRQPHEGNSQRPPAIDNHRSLVLPFMIPEGIIKMKRFAPMKTGLWPCSFNTVGCGFKQEFCAQPKLVANSPPSATPNCAVRKKPGPASARRHHRQSMGLAPGPLIGNNPSSTSVGIHEEHRELKCESMVVFRFGSSNKPPRRATCQEGVLEGPAASEKTTHRTSGEAKDGTTTDGTARFSEKKQSIPRPSILAATITGSAPTPRGRNRTFDGSACSIQWVGCFSSASPVRCWKATGPVCRSRSFNQPVLLQSAKDRICFELTNLDDPLARDFPPCPIQNTEVFRIKTRLKIPMIKLSKILEPPYSNGVPAPSAH
jgi:hypothetical protein